MLRPFSSLFFRSLDYLFSLFLLLLNSCSSIYLPFSFSLRKSTCFCLRYQEFIEYTVIICFSRSTPDSIRVHCIDMYTSDSSGNFLNKMNIEDSVTQFYSYNGSLTIYEERV